MLIDVSSCVSASVLVGILASSIIGTVVWDEYYWFILSSDTEDGTSSMIRRFTTLPDHKHMSLQETGGME